MSYLVLARKYRPQTFDEVVQQEHVTRTIANAIVSDRVAHAILFAGPRGTGKTTIARILAKAMNCAGDAETAPCNTCRSCNEITAGAGADVFEIDGASNNGVDQIRELRENIKYMPVHSPFKIFIIDEVHMLSTPAFNALLKTLEEPPAHIMFLMATTEPQKIPVTILSRCQRHDLKRVSGSAISAHLAHICKNEGIEIERQSLDLIAAQAGGSMRDALSLLDQVAAGVAGSVHQDQVLEILGIIDRSSISDISIAILNGELDRVLEIIDKVHAYGHSIPELYSSIVQYFRDLLIIKMVAMPDRLVDLPESDIDNMQTLGKEVSSVFLQQTLDLLIGAEKRIRWSANPKMALEVALIKLLQVRPVLPIGDLIEKLDKLREGIGPVSEKVLSETQKPYSAPGMDEPAVPEPEAGPVRPENLLDASGPAPQKVSKERADNGEVWQQLMDIISEKHPSLAPNLVNSRLVGLAEGKLEVQVNGSGFNFNRVKREDNIRLLESVCSAFFDRPTRLTLKPGDNKGGQDKQKKKTDLERMKQGVLDHPLVADTIEIFDGKLVDVKINTVKT